MVSFYRSRLFYALSGAGGLLAVNYLLNRTEYTGRHRLMFFPKSFDKKLGKWAEDSLLHQFAQKVLPESSPPAQMVKRLAKKIVEGNELGGMEWRVMVIDSPIPNAFVIPNGVICVFTGLFPLIKTENQLSSVLAHEMAHVVARHGAEALSWNVGFLLFDLLFLHGSSGAGLFQLIINLPHSRARELEADLIGLHLMGKACIPLESASQMQRSLAKFMKESTRSNGLSFLRTHPPSLERADVLDKQIPDFKKIYGPKCKAAQQFSRASYSSYFNSDE